MVCHLTLCADDFGADAGSTSAILALANRRRVNATSAMVTGPECAAAAGDLLGTYGLQIGLHVALSDGRATAPSELAPSGQLPHIDRLTAAAFAGRAPLEAIAGEIERQFDRFEVIFGRSPDFVDAHQHSHILPGIRGQFLQKVARRAPNSWVRTCEDHTSAIMRRGVSRWRAIRSSLLSYRFGEAAERRHIATNDGFGGLYNLRGDQTYAHLFPRWLLHPGKRHLIICHPATASAVKTRFGANRVQEFTYLSDTALPELLERANLGLSTH